MNELMKIIVTDKRTDPNLKNLWFKNEYTEMKSLY